MTKLIIFCAVFPIFLGLFTFSPNFLSELSLRTFSPNILNCFRTFSPKISANHRRFSPKLFAFSPNFFRLQCTFRGYYLPCWSPPQQISFRTLLSSNYRMWYRKKSFPFDIIFLSGSNLSVSTYSLIL